MMTRKRDSSHPVRVVLADDHALVRAGIRKLLESLDGVEIVAEASGGMEVIEHVRAHIPDAVFMDLSMEDMTGVEATRHVKTQFPDVAIIILSMHADGDNITAGLRAGAAGYLLKSAAPMELGMALDAVLAGDRYLSPLVSKRLLENFIDRPRAESGPTKLSPRQLEILRMLANGHSAKQIAFALDVSVKTVHSHRANLMKRLEIRTVSELVRYAIRTGLVSSG